MDLGSVVHMRGLSGSTLRQVINRLTNHHVSDRTITAASYERFNTLKHTMRFQRVGGGEVDFEICEPKALLALVLRENAIVREWFEEAWRAHPSSPSEPWHLLVGWDEFCPGNKAAVKSSRKTMTLSFSFVELRGRLHHDAAWVTPLAIRASVLAEVAGGWSAVLRGFLRLMLLDVEGLYQAGYPIPIGGSAHLLFAQVHTLLSDGDGVRQALEWLGAGALKMCFRHWNVFDKNSDLADRCPGSKYVESSSTDASSFRTWTNDDLQAAAGVVVAARRRHHDGHIPMARVEQIQRVY